MSFFEMLNMLIIGPIKLLLEVIFSFVNARVDNPGLSIIFLSLTINILILPLYMRADVMQKKAREKEQALRAGIEHIKKSFSGDEKMMILQTYYRQNDYSPFSVLQSSVSLLLQIPFFMAAVQVLSNMPCLDMASLGPIADLGAPDALIKIGGITLNLLPILMTAINFISSALFSKGGSLKEKIQLYGLAVFFLIFLYGYPSGLVFYWLLNNVFSLVKTIFYKLKNPKKVLCCIVSVLGLFLIGCVIFMPFASRARNAVMLFAGVLLQLPLIFMLLRGKVKIAIKEEAPNGKVFTLGTLFLTLFIGIFIPSTFIAASPQEYVNTSYYYNPIWFVVSSGLLAGGTFLVWFRVFYWLANDKFKVIFEKLIWAVCGIAIVNYMFFGTDFGNISTVLKYDVDPYATLTSTQLLVNAAIVAVLFGALYLMKLKKVKVYLLLTAAIAIFGLSVYNTADIKKSVEAIPASAFSDEGKAEFKLSKKGKNVVILMLDRAMSEYVPYIMEEHPELAEKFSGFTYYRNTISYGRNTNFGTPPLLGGYEYTPVEMNKRDSESLMEKHNESHMVMPTIFAENGYDVTVANPIYIDYKWKVDLSFFDEYSGVKAVKTDSLVSGEYDNAQYAAEKNKRNFFCFALMKSLPLCVQKYLYDDAEYNQEIFTKTQFEPYTGQKIISNQQASGLDRDFMNSYEVFNKLPEVTEIVNDDSNTFLFMNSNITHSPALLQLPDYTPELSVDNTAYENANKKQYELDGNMTMKMDDINHVMHYHINASAFMQVGKWLDYLKENGVYDNTRIILVGDHGRNIAQFEELIAEGDGVTIDLQSYTPLLMVKDFNDNDYTVSDEFMTNADVPSIAMAELIENPVNPFTGKEIDDDEKYAHKQYIIDSPDWDIKINNGNTFMPACWIEVEGGLYDEENYEIYGKQIVLKEHSFENLP